MPLDSGICLVFGANIKGSGGKGSETTVEKRRGKKSEREGGRQRGVSERGRERNTRASGRETETIRARGGKLERKGDNWRESKRERDREREAPPLSQRANHRLPALAAPDATSVQHLRRTASTASNEEPELRFHKPATMPSKPQNWDTAPLRATARTTYMLPRR